MIKLALIIAISTILSLFLGSVGIGKESIIMVFLVGALIVTVTTKGYFYGIFAAIGSVLIFNYYFTVPIHTLITYDSNDVILMVSFLCVSLVSGTMTKRFQKQLQISQQNEHTARLLYRITESFVNITGQKNIIMKGINYIYENTGYNSRVLLSEPGEVYVDESKEFTTDKMMEIPIRGLTKQLGVMQVAYSKERFTFEHELLIKTVGTQMGLSLDRELIYNERENIRIAMEREKMHSNLLRAISHDLRTPLTGIVGASGVILENLNQLEKSSIESLVSDINEEAIWLNSLVENILNMTRIYEGKLVIEKKYEVVDDVVSEAINHANSFAKTRSIFVSMPDEIVTVLIDGKLIVQVLINLLDNAIKHTEDHCSIFVNVYIEDDMAVFEVADNGDGIDESIHNSLFDSFVTISSKIIDNKRGMGLGLSICKAIVEAHGGTITGGKSTEGGALFSFRLPLTGGE
ncbi:integral membrane sensor signal transduction histidine kinase [Alkaliphilus metalliredigens QYMF]|uniref:histidine kinase n=1 Tax=Alkaliphilus metalliredigens (strain QYMF) TaxID=293826 RepID=A6TTB9_ALKMQ|nr:ATP-binding protein [Alkaliphilus metalliredigens]ABR49437.1 integral membrane sensor signal transduction histidine kinase [Alkaliphilus metalliredigens QYMF]